MGVVRNITIESFPKQSDLVGRRVNVCFHYNHEKVVCGEVVRADEEQPFEMIIKLDDGRYVRSTECQYTPSAPATSSEVMTQP
jgi:hypothetical protein